MTAKDNTTEKDLLLAMAGCLSSLTAAFAATADKRLQDMLFKQSELLIEKATAYYEEA